MKKVVVAAMIGMVTAVAGTGCAVTSGQESTGAYVDDATITGRVKTSLLNDPDVAGLKIDVDTFKGVVTLSGQVKTKLEEDKAIGIARRTPGVTDVKSTLQINPAQE